jgi:DNA-binding transcriptional regulator WhiA
MLEMMYIATQKCETFTFNEKLSVYYTPTPNDIRSYLLGAMHDRTSAKYTYRISQKSKHFILMIVNLVKMLGFKAWWYKEGKDRNLYIAEFSKAVLKDFRITSNSDKLHYAKGYFDTDGSVPKKKFSRFYIYFSQKNYMDIKQLKNYLNDLGIDCGKIHIPSVAKDPDYYRFYVLRKSHDKFCRVVGSWHIEKASYLRKKI